MEAHGLTTESVDISDSRLQIEGLNERRIIIKVDKDSEDRSFYKSIGDAVLAAQENNIIQIASGIYWESFVVQTPGLTFEPLEEDGKVVIISTQKPWVTVNTDAECKTEFK